MKNTHIVFLFLIFNYAQISAQNHFNSLVDFGYQRNSIYAVSSEDSVIHIHGRVLPSDTININEIFYAKLDSHGNAVNFNSLNRGKFITNNLINEIVFQDGTYVSSFSEEKTTILYQIVNNSYEIIDTFTNPLDLESPFQIFDFFYDDFDNISYTGGYLKVISDNPISYDTRIFINNFTDPSENFELMSPISEAPGGDLAQMETGYLFYTLDRNYEFPTPENWGAEVYFFKLNDTGQIQNTFKTEPTDQMHSVFDIYRNPDDSFIMSGREAKADTESSGIVQRSVVYKFSFEDGLEWKVYPYGDEWKTVTEELLELIPTIDNDGYIVLGNKVTTDSLGFYHAATLSKITNEGQLNWTKFYNSGHQAFHSPYDINYHLDGYVVVGDVANFETFPQGDATRYGWIFHVNKEGGFDVLSSSNDLNKISSIEISIHPNPASDMLHIAVQDYLYFDRMTITDMNGRLIMEQRIVPSFVRLSTIDAGAYVLNLYKNSKMLVSRKFIKK